MAGDENKGLVQRVFREIWDGGNLDRVDELFSGGFVRHGPTSLEGDIRGRDGFKQLVTMYRTAFPDLKVPVEEQVIEGDVVVTRWTARGTHGGDLQGIPPTGKPINVQGVLIDRVSGGQIQEEWAVYDSLGLMQQVGAQPAAG
jgi:steroid delta-isomerase-like uncharacterized protein